MKRTKKYELIVNDCQFNGQAWDTHKGFSSLLDTIYNAFMNE